MIDLAIFKDQTVAVMGLGRSGLVAARALVVGGARVAAWDDDPARREAAADLPLADLAAADWSAIAPRGLSPGIPHTWPEPHPAAAAARAAAVEIVGDIELLVRACPEARFIGVTGTNGKSTTTALIGHLLRAAGRRIEVGGNLGTPALALAPLGAAGAYVLEMSSYQLEITPSARFDVAVLLNLSPDHLDRHGGMTGYVAAKRRIFDSGPTDQTAIVGVDDPQSAEIFDDLLAGAGRRVVPISAEIRVEGGVYAADGRLHDTLDRVDRPVVTLSGIQTLPGSHNAQNAAAAYAAVRAMGIGAEAIGDAMPSYPGLPHRQQLAAIVDGVRYVNDSKATNPEAAARALACYDAIYWIAGGRAKEGGLAAIESYLTHIRCAFLIGEAAEQMAEALEGRVETEFCGDLATAVGRAREVAADVEGAVVLLSPACASFDQFPNFEARGDRFRDLAAALPGVHDDVGQGGRAA